MSALILIRKKITGALQNPKVVRRSSSLRNLRKTYNRVPFTMHLDLSANFHPNPSFQGLDNVWEMKSTYGCPP